MIAHEGEPDLTGLGLTAAMHDVLVERQRQQTRKGWSTSHDDGHNPGDLALAAASYVLTAVVRDRPTNELNPPRKLNLLDSVAQYIWPWHLEDRKTKNLRKDLVRAAALLIAEIDRMDRATLCRIEPPSELANVVTADRTGDGVEAEVSSAQKAIEFYKASVLKTMPRYVPSRVRVLPTRPDKSPLTRVCVEPGEYDCRTSTWGSVSVMALDGSQQLLQMDDFEPVHWVLNKDAAACADG